MTDLLTAEFLRLVSRRILWALLLGVAALGAIVTLTNLGLTEPLSVAEQQEAQQIHENELVAWEEACGDEPADCGDWPRPTRDQYEREVWSYADYLDNSLFGGSFVALIGSLFLGIGMVGGEINAGTLGTQLTFTPERNRTFVTKVTAAVAGGALIALTFAASTVIIGTLSHLLMRGADDVTAGPELPLAILRLLLVGAMLALLGAAATLGLGSSGWAGGLIMAVAFGSLVVSSSLPSASLVLRLMPWPNLVTLVDGSYEHWGPESYELETILTFWQSFNYAAIILIVVTALAVWAFRRKDVLV